jgi:hypothetical protein
MENGKPTGFPVYRLVFPVYRSVFQKNQKLIFLSLTNRFLVNRRNRIRPVLSGFCKNRPVYVDIIIHGLESTCINKFSVIASVGIS